MKFLLALLRSTPLTKFPANRELEESFSSFSDLFGRTVGRILEVSGVSEPWQGRLLEFVSEDFSEETSESYTPEEITLELILYSGKPQFRQFHLDQPALLQEETEAIFSSLVNELAVQLVLPSSFEHDPEKNPLPILEEVLTEWIGLLPYRKVGLAARNILTCIVEEFPETLRDNPTSRRWITEYLGK